MINFTNLLTRIYSESDEYKVCVSGRGNGISMKSLRTKLIRAESVVIRASDAALVMLTAPEDSILKSQYGNGDVIPVCIKTIRGVSSMVLVRASEHDDNAMGLKGYFLVLSDGVYTHLMVNHINASDDYIVII